MSIEQTNAFETLARLAESGCTLPSKFYPNQIDAASTAISHFSEGTRYVLLSAQMQSGKTGCALYTAFKMLVEEYVDQVFVISGSHETVLRKQWIDEIPWHLYSYCIDNGITDKKAIMAMGEKIINGVFFRQDLEENVGHFTEKYLILWDESHYAVQEKQQLHQFFSKVGIHQALQGDTSTLEDKQSYVLSITATRGAEQAKMIGANDTQAVDCWASVVLKPGEGYRGVVDIKNKELIFPSVPIDEDHQDELFNIINKYNGQQKYIIMRTTSEKEQIIDALQAANPGVFDVVRFNMETKQKKKGTSKSVSINMLNDEPDRLTLFLVRQMLRMGKQLEKDHICAVYEHAANQNFDTGLQSLLGRTCGYNVSHDIHVYMDSGADNRALNNYISVIESGFANPIGKTLNINIGKKTPITTPLLFPNAPHRIGDDTEEYTMGKECKTSTDAFRKHQLQTFCQELLNSGVNTDSRYSEEQQQEITQLLEDIVANGASPETVAIHKTHKPDGKQYVRIAKESRLTKLADAIVNNTPVESTMVIQTKMVIYRVSGKNFSDNEEAAKTIKMGDCIVMFYTDAESTFTQKAAQTDYSSNERDVFATSSTPETKVSERDGDGSIKCTMPEGAKTSTAVFKNFVRQNIKDYLDPSRVFKSNPFLNTRHVLFDRTIFKNAAYMNAIFKELEKEFARKISIKATYTRGKGPLCCQLIQWTSK